jgi:Predicted hydrolases or acyltransferases (alpha/beta hydrolase superfamily)
MAVKPNAYREITEAMGSAEKSRIRSEKSLFLIHGMWATSDCWQNYRNFSEQRGYLTRAPTLLHHKEYPYPKELKDTHITDYVEQCVKEIKDMEGKPVIIGHSMGGLIAQKLAELGLAKKLILIAPAPPKGISPLSWSVLWTFIRSVPEIALGKPFKVPLSKARYGVMNTLSAEEQEKLYAQFVYESPWAARKFVVGGVAVDAGEVTSPVLVVAGSEDRTIVPRVARKIAQRYHASYIEYPGYCHFRLIQGTGWQKVAEDIASWVGNK